MLSKQQKGSPWEEWAGSCQRPAWAHHNTLFQLDYLLTPCSDHLLLRHAAFTAPENLLWWGPMPGILFFQIPTWLFFLPHLFTQICPPSSQVFLVFWLNSSPRHVFPLPLFNFFLYDTHYYLMYFDIYYLSCYLTHSFHMRIQTPEDRDYFVSLAFFSTQKNA